MKTETHAMMKAARKAQRLAGEWIATFQITGEIDAAKVMTMAKARLQVTTAKPANDVEALLIVAAARTVGAYGYTLTQDETELEPEIIKELHGAFCEIAVALQNVKVYLESKTDTNLKTLGLFDERETLQ